MEFILALLFLVFMCVKDKFGVKKADRDHENHVREMKARGFDMSGWDK